MARSSASAAARSSFRSRSTRSSASLRGSLQRASTASGSAAPLARSAGAQRRVQEIGVQRRQLVLHGERRLRRPLAVARQLLRRRRQAWRATAARPAGNRRGSPSSMLQPLALGRQHQIAGAGQRLERGGAAGDAGRRAHRFEGRRALGQGGALGLADQRRRQVAQRRHGGAQLLGRGHACRAAAAGGAGSIARRASGSAARPPACGSAPRP